MTNSLNKKYLWSTDKFDNYKLISTIISICSIIKLILQGTTNTILEDII